MLTKHQYDIVILGAGFGGLGMGAQLMSAGYENFIILEKGRDIGGVWRDNSYLGAACDIEARLYSYSFFPYVDASKAYPEQPEIMDYIHRLADHYKLNAHIQLNSEIIRATWNNTGQYWEFELNNGTQLFGRVFIPAWGQLNTPSIPHLEGLDQFKGKFFHSAQWDHSYDLNGKNIASIGAAASAVQYVPEVAKLAKHLTVFQRSANWVVPRFQKTFSQAEIEEFRRDPQSYRTEIYDILEDGFTRFFPDSESQLAAIEVAKNHLKNQVPDPILRKKLTPDYKYGCKRVLRTSDYYPALTRENVLLETTPIQEFSNNGIKTTDGIIHEVDLIIFGTGFKSQAFYGQLDITGLNGVKLSTQWRDGAEAYLGISTPNFPNMFILYGPNTNLGHNSILTMMEIQQEYILQLLNLILSQPTVALDVKKDICKKFNTSLQESLSNTAFASGCASWYVNSTGKVINNWSSSVEDYRKRVLDYNPNDYHHLS